MARYKIIVSCGTNVTSVAVAKHIRDDLEKKGITSVETPTVRVAELLNSIDKHRPDCIVFAGQPPGGTTKFQCPAFPGYPFLTGLGRAKVIDEIVEVLKKPHWAGIERPSEV